MNLSGKICRFIMDNSKQARITRQRLKFIFLIALFTALFWVIPFNRVISAIFSASLPLLLLGLLIQIPSTFLNALQLKLLTQKQGLSLGILQVWMINLAIKFYTLFMQGTLAASGIRWYKLSQKDNKPAEALASVAFYRLIETFITIFLGLSFYLLNPAKPVELNASLLIAVLAAMTIFWIGITRLSLPLLSWINYHFIHFIEKPGWKSAYKITEKLLLAVAAYSGFSVWELFQVILAGISQQLVSAVSNYYFALAIGIVLPIKDIIWISCIIVLASQIPIAIAGGLGVREASLVVLMPAFGVSRELALAYSLLLFIKSLLISLAGGLIELIQTLHDKPAAHPEINKG